MPVFQNYFIPECTFPKVCLGDSESVIGAVVAGYNGLPVMKTPAYSLPEITEVMYKDKSTIVRWADGTKTYVVCGEGETYDKYTGFMGAVMKKLFGSTGNAKRIIKEKNLTEIASKKAAQEKAEEEKRIEEEKKAKAKAERELINRMAEEMRLEMIAKAKAKRMVKAEQDRDSKAGA